MFKVLASATRAGAILCSLQATTGPPASASERQIEITNNTRMAIIEVYASPVGMEGWHQDVLGDEILPPTNSIVVKWDVPGDYCRFDLRTVFDDGNSWVRRDVNVCELERYAISYR
jgi:hypothetical protein